MDYGCLMLDFKIKDWSNWSNLIDKNDLYLGDDEPGLVQDPHCTILYGFKKEINPKEFKLPSARLFKFRLERMGIFELDSYDVLIYHLESKLARLINERLSNQFPNEEPYSEYKPHLTVGYFKKGQAKKYLKFKNDNIKYSIIPFQWRYSFPNGREVTF